MKRIHSYLRLLSKKHGKVDHLDGLKENVIIGKLIPAGTGAKKYKKTDYDLEFDIMKDEPLEALEQELMD